MLADLLIRADNGYTGGGGVGVRGSLCASNGVRAQLEIIKHYGARLRHVETGGDAMHSIRHELSGGGGQDKERRMLSTEPRIVQRHRFGYMDV